MKGRPASAVPRCVEPFVCLLAESLSCVACQLAALVLPALRNSLAEVNVKKSKIGIQK